MDTFFYFLFVSAYVILLIWAIQSSSKSLSYKSFLYLVIAGLIYDNAVLVSGRFIGVGDLLEILNVARYWVHAIVTPTLVLFCYGVLTSARIKWLEDNKVKWGFFFITLLLIGTELVMEAIPLKLKPEWENDVLQYVSAASNNHPPYMIIAVTLILLVAGIIVYKKTKWKWMLLGTVLMGLGSTLSPFFKSGALTNGFELILIFSLVLTKKHVEQK
ncbi:hypothetical protein [Gracilibacillus xinjiangensis]|uniref:Phospholipid phosphatase n=1 Tax=Gracilibacillus xinjiangensis TaxID=1193282 RepID=A0ABV8WP15_9BACI